MTRRNGILSKLFFSLALSAAALAVTSSASAQTNMRVTVPFAFTADSQTFPAGSYTVSTQPTFPSAVHLSNVKTGETKIVLVRADSGEPNNGPARLTFRRQPGGVYLSQVWSSRTSVHSELLSHPKADAEMAKSEPASGTFDIAAK